MADESSGEALCVSTSFAGKVGQMISERAAPKTQLKRKLRGLGSSMGARGTQESQVFEE